MHDRNRLYVGNINYSASMKDVRTAFEQCGYTVRDLYMPEDPETGKPKGFAFVTLQDNAQAEQAIDEMDGQPLLGRNLRVNVAEPRQNKARR